MQKAKPQVAFALPAVKADRHKPSATVRSVSTAMADALFRLGIDSGRAARFAWVHGFFNTFPFRPGRRRHEQLPEAIAPKRADAQSRARYCNRALSPSIGRSTHGIGQ